MSTSARKILRESLIWPILGVVLSGAFVAPVAHFLLAQSNGAVHRRTVLLEMSWKRADPYYGPNFIQLESPCLGNTEPGCFCSHDFKITRTKEFADYVESFGNKKVPVKYHVDYDRNDQVVRAILEAVGEWPEERFHTNEKSLSEGSRIRRNQPTAGHFRYPADCFPKSVK
jgi:hypothetical protein